ncbi:MAG: ECF transporter S component [Oscillibacter sp.]
MGLAVGFISPLLRSMSGMPPIWIAIPMAFEMATYGAIAGLLYRKLPKTGWRIYASLISAMVAGRLVWGLVVSARGPSGHGVQPRPLPLRRGDDGHPRHHLAAHPHSHPCGGNGAHKYGARRVST